jgi:hypothetical protein
MALQPLQQVDEPLPMAEEAAAALPNDSVVTSEQAAVEAAPQGDSNEVVSRTEPAIPLAFLPRRNGNLTVLDVRPVSPLPIKGPPAPVTPISQPTPNLIPFRDGYGPGK